MSINLSDYHESIKTWLSEHETLSQWFNYIDSYPESTVKLSTPFLFFSVGEWDPSDTDRSDGRNEWNLNLTFYVGVNGLDSSLGEDNAGSDYQIMLRDLSMAVCEQLQGNRLGIDSSSVKPAKVTSAQPDGFEVELDDYDIYSINVIQPFITGSVNSDLEATEYTPNQVYLGFTPKIGSDHEDDYELIYESTDTDS